jgi:hypothetical protein
MKRDINSTIGRVASISIATETIIFALSLLWGIIFHTKYDQIIGYLASLFLAASVVVLMACLYENINKDVKIFGLLALAASIVYAVDCINNYYLQLSIVVINPLNHPEEILKIFKFAPGSPTFALDMLGYGFLCFSTLVAGFALTDIRDKALKFLCFINGAIAVPTFIAPIISGIFRSTSGQANDIGSYILFIWCMIFIPIAILFFQYFTKHD